MKKSIKKIIYQDDYFTFTYDDLYIAKRTDGQIDIYLNISRYFNISHSVLTSNNRKDIFQSFRAKTRKKKLILITTISMRNNIDEYTIESGIFNFATIKLSCCKLCTTRFIPSDYVNISYLPQALFDTSANIAIKNIDNVISKLHITDRRYRSSHQNVSIPKKFKKMIRNMRRHGYDSDKTNNYIHLIEKYKSHSTRARKLVYKKTKPFADIYSLPVIDNPLIAIAATCNTILYDKMNTRSKTYHAFNDLAKHLTYTKKNYRLVRMLFVLTALHRYDEAAELIIHAASIIKNEYYDRNIYFEKHNNKPSQITTPVKLTEKTISIYKKKFDNLYHQIASFTYRDIYKLDNLVQAIRFPQFYKSISKDKDYQYVKENISKDNHFLDMLSLQRYIMPYIHSRINENFKHYVELDRLQTSSQDSFTYGFYYKSYNKNYQDDPAGFAFIKPIKEKQDDK